MINYHLPYNGTNYQLMNGREPREYYIVANNTIVNSFYANSDDEAKMQFEFKVPFLH